MKLYEKIRSGLFVMVSFFFEVHPDQSCALSDGSNMVNLGGFKQPIKGL